MNVKEIRVYNDDINAVIDDTDYVVTKNSVNAGIKGIRAVGPPVPPNPTTPVVNIHNKVLPKTPRMTSRERLDALGHDPLVELVELSQRLKATLTAMEMIRDGLAKGKFSPEYYSQTLTLLQKTNNDLLRYGYARVSETVVVEQQGSPMLSITLTDNGTFNKENDAGNNFEQG